MNLKLPHYLKFAVPAAGFLGCGLYTILFTAGLDARGLPDPNHWSHWGLWLLAAAVLVTAFLALRAVPAKTDGIAAYPKSIRSGIGCLIAALACFAFATPIAKTGDLATADMVLRGISGAALGITAFCRFMGKKPFFLLHGFVCLYLAFRMINQYRLWSADPQIIQYCFYLCAYVALILSAYHQAAFDADAGSFKKLWFWSLLAAFGCFVTFAGPQERLFMPAFGIWVLSGLSAVTPVSRPAEPEDV